MGSLRLRLRPPLTSNVIRWSHIDELFRLIVRFLGYIVSELLLVTFFYAIGWPFVKAATLGKYPKREWLSGPKNEAYVCCVGIFVFSISPMAALGSSAYNNALN